MVTRAYFARRFLALKLLRGALLAGALYDAALAALFLWRPETAARQLGLTASESLPLAALVALWLILSALPGEDGVRQFARRHEAGAPALETLPDMLHGSLHPGAEAAQEEPLLQRQPQRRPGTDFVRVEVVLDVPRPERAAQRGQRPGPAGNPGQDAGGRGKPQSWRRPCRPVLGV